MSVICADKPQTNEQWRCVVFDQMVTRLEYAQYDNDKTEFLMEYQSATHFTGVCGVLGCFWISV